MGEGRGKSRVGKVGDVPHYVEDVLHKEERGDGVGLHLGKQVGGQEHAQQRGHAHDGKHRGQEPRHALQDKAWVVEAPRATNLALYRERGEVAGEHEEDRHAKVAARKPARVCVVDQDCKDRQDTQAVERAHVVGARGPCRRGLLGGVLDGCLCHMEPAFAAGRVTPAEFSIAFQTIPSRLFECGQGEAMRISSPRMPGNAVR